MADEVTEPTADQAIDALIQLGRTVQGWNDDMTAVRIVRHRLRMLERQLDERGVGMLQDAAGGRAVPLPEMVTVQGGPLDGQGHHIIGTHLVARDEVITADADDPLVATVTVKAWYWHLYSDGTYRLEPYGTCPTLLTENPGEDGKGG